MTITKTKPVFKRYNEKRKCPHCGYDYERVVYSPADKGGSVCPFCHKRSDKSNSCISQLKSTKLKKCLNPKCDYYYYGFKRDRYCSKKCRIQATNIKTREYQTNYAKERYKTDEEYRKKQKFYNKRWRDKKRLNI